MTEISRHDQNPLSVQQSINRIMSLPLKSFYTSILTKEETDEQNTMQLKQFCTRNAYQQKTLCSCRKRGSDFSLAAVKVRGVRQRWYFLTILSVINEITARLEDGTCFTAAPDYNNEKEKISPAGDWHSKHT